MSTQLSINEDLIKYLQNVGYRKDPLIDELEKETKALGKVAQMQIAKEQGQFLEIIVNISKAKSCLEIGRFTGLSTLYMARGLPSDGKIITVDSSSSNVITIPANSSETIVAGYKIEIVQLGSGTTSIQPAIGVSLKSKGRESLPATVPESPLEFDSRYSKITLLKIDTNTWLAYGDIIESSSSVPYSFTPTSYSFTPYKVLTSSNELNLFCISLTASSPQTTLSLVFPFLHLKSKNLM